MISLGIFLGLEAKLTGIRASRPRANSFLFQKQDLKKNLLQINSDSLKIR